MTTLTLGFLVYNFLLDYLPHQKGLRASTIRSYRDTLRMFLISIATDTKHGVSDLQLDQLTFEQVLAFLRNLEQVRHNGVSTRNQRLAAIHAFFEYLARKLPEMLHVSEKVAAIPIKRTPLPETYFLSPEEMQRLLAELPVQGRYALRDYTLLLFLYNTGARVQEVADLRLEHLTLEHPPSVRLHGKGGKWRSSPLWGETVRALRELLKEQRTEDPQAPVFSSASGKPLTRFGIYKRVRKHAACIEDGDTVRRQRRITRRGQCDPRLARSR
jgi:site-specific recombinase XerD